MSLEATSVVWRENAECVVTCSGMESLVVMRVYWAAVID